MDRGWQFASHDFGDRGIDQSESESNCGLRDQQIAGDCLQSNDLLLECHLTSP